MENITVEHCYDEVFQDNTCDECENKAIIVIDSINDKIKLCYECSEEVAKGIYACMST